MSHLCIYKVLLLAFSWPLWHGRGRLYSTWYLDCIPSSIPLISTSLKKGISRLSTASIFTTKLSSLVDSVWSCGKTRTFKSTNVRVCCLKNRVAWATSAPMIASGFTDLLCRMFLLRFRWCPFMWPFIPWTPLQTGTVLLCMHFAWFFV